MHPGDGRRPPMTARRRTARRPRPRNRNRRTCAFLLLAALSAATSAAPAAAPATATPEALPPASAPAPPAESPGQAGAGRYRVVVDAPADLRDTLAASVDLIRWQTYADMTDDLLAELQREAIDQAKEAAATEGYFEATVDVGIDRSTSPMTVTLRVVPGAQTHVASVKLRVSGAAEHDPDGEAAIAKIRAHWDLPPGAPFRQSEWERAKTRAVAMLAGSGYAAAKLATSLAQVDPATSTAELDVDIDSGPAFHVGDLDITGLSRYPPDLVR